MIHYATDLDDIDIWKRNSAQTLTNSAKKFRQIYSIYIQTNSAQTNIWILYSGN